MKTTETTTDISTRAFVSGWQTVEIAGPAGTYIVSARHFIIRADALADITPSTVDRIYFEARWWEILKLKPVCAGARIVAYTFYGS